MDSHIIASIIKEIEGFTPKVEAERVGRVVNAGDGIVEIEGLGGALMSEIVAFDITEGDLSHSLERTEVLYGLVLNVEENSIKTIVLGNADRVSEGMIVKSTGKVLSIPVGDALLGRVVNALATPIDGKGSVGSTVSVPIEREAHGVIERQSVSQPLQTGIKAIDAMIPIGRGQRELIIGDRFTGKTSIAIDTIINQKNEPVETRPICIYVAVGQKESKTARIVAELAEAGALPYTIIVNAPASAPAALQFLAPFTGAAIGEYFMDKGKDALVVYDDLSKQAVAYRQLSLLLRRPPGREAYPGDIFYLHSRLLERAAKLSDAKGGGSLTALPIIETQEGDVSAYIPTNVISITDGQIFLDAGLFNKGVRPAIDVGISVSRVGSAAQTKAMKSVAGTLRLSLAQFRELEAFMQFAQDLDPETAKRIASGERMVEILKQGKHAPLPFEEQVVVLYAAGNGHLDMVPVLKVRSAEEKLLTFMRDQHKEILDSIRNEKKVGDEIKPKLDSALSLFVKSHSDTIL